MPRRMSSRLVRVRIRFGPFEGAGTILKSALTKLRHAGGGGLVLSPSSSRSFCLSGLEVSCRLELCGVLPFCLDAYVGAVGVAGRTLMIVWFARPRRIRPRCTMPLPCWLNC